MEFRRSFGPLKCCHPQISDLGFIISWWQLSCEIFLQILTSLELHSNSANRPGILLSHDGSLEVNLLMIFLELSLKKTSRMTKSDIWGWQHLRVPKYLLDKDSRVAEGKARDFRWRDVCYNKGKNQSCLRRVTEKY